MIPCTNLHLTQCHTYNQKQPTTGLKSLQQNRFRPIPQRLNNQPVPNGNPTSPDYNHLQHGPETNFVINTPTSSRPNNGESSASSTAQRHKITSQSPASLTPRYNTPARSLAPIPPPVLNGSFSDLSNDVAMTSEITSINSNVEAAEYSGENYLRSMPRSKGAKFRVIDDDIDRPVTSKRDDVLMEMKEFYSDDDNHLYAEIPK